MRGRRGGGGGEHEYGQGTLNTGARGRRTPETLETGQGEVFTACSPAELH